MMRGPPKSTLFPDTTLSGSGPCLLHGPEPPARLRHDVARVEARRAGGWALEVALPEAAIIAQESRELEGAPEWEVRSEEHTSELQSRQYLVCRLLLEKTNHVNAYLRDEWAPLGDVRVSPVGYFVAHIGGPAPKVLCDAYTELS